MFGKFFQTYIFHESNLNNLLKNLIKFIRDLKIFTIPAVDWNESLAAV